MRRGQARRTIASPLAARITEARVVCMATPRGAPGSPPRDPAAMRPGGIGKEPRTMEFSMDTLGWTPAWAQAFASATGDGRDGLLPGRVAREDRDLYQVFTNRGELVARLSGRLRHAARERAALPAVGDWTALALARDGALARIQTVLARKSCFSRKAVFGGGPAGGAGKTAEQVLAANVDFAFLVSGLDEDFNPRRIERYLAIAWDSGARPVIVLNKSDLCGDLGAKRMAIERSSAGVPIHAVSATSGAGMEDLAPYLCPGWTVVFLGSSGVGKSSLINRLLGEERQRTRGVREFDGRGRHVTTARQMFVLSGGALLIDTPGLREIQPWEVEEGVGTVFDDIAALAEDCRFRDCRHLSEPGCAVKQAVAEGRLDEGRLSNYLRLQREEAALAVRRSLRARMVIDRRGKHLR